MSKGFVIPSNSFNSPCKIWTKVLTKRGYKLSSANVKGEVHGTRFKCWRVLDIVIFRATCLAISLWQTLREKFFGESKTEKRFSATMLTAVVWTIRYKKKRKKTSTRICIYYFNSESKYTQRCHWYHWCIAIKFGRCTTCLRLKTWNYNNLMKLRNRMKENAKETNKSR